MSVCSFKPETSQPSGIRCLLMMATAVFLGCCLATAAVASQIDDEERDSIRLLQELTESGDGAIEALTHGVEAASLEGVASYYARRFNGRKTTSGQRYNPQKYTAAHAFLPLGTLVRVVNKRTGAEVLVTVNDRCARTPYHFIDLSRAAAEKIGIYGLGKAPVIIIPDKGATLLQTSSL